MGLFLRADAQAAVTSSAVRHRAVAAAWNALRPITASAERIHISGLASTTRPYSTWQTEAWTGYERVGEIHYGFNLLANLLSRVRIYAAVVGDANEAPTDLGSDVGRKAVKSKLADDALKIMSELHASDFSGLVRSFSLNLSVPGECYLIQLPSGRWTIRSVDEIQVRSTGYLLVPMRGATTEQIVLPEGTYVARIWRQHPRYSREPDSSMVGVADSIEELLMLTRLVRGAARSRMNAGMLFIPDGLATVGAQPTAEPPVEEPVDPITALQHASTVPTDGGFLQQLMESMTTPISDEGSASSVVPMLTTGPAELGAAIRHITFERSSDEWLVKRADQALERILNGIDIPKEVVTGLESVKYSNAVVIDENLYKSNIEPLGLVFVDALTSVYLKPRLKGMGWTDEDLSHIVVWYDPSEIVTRPNSADEATQGIDRMLLSPAAWRREHGYAETDAPSEAELATLLMMRISTIPDMAMVELMKQALPNLFGKLEIPLADPLAGNHNISRFPNPQEGDVTAPPKVTGVPRDIQKAATRQVGLK
jgi:hypothetical protein